MGRGKSPFSLCEFQFSTSSCAPHNSDISRAEVQNFGYVMLEDSMHALGLNNIEDAPHQFFWKVRSVFYAHV